MFSVTLGLVNDILEIGQQIQLGIIVVTLLGLTGMILLLQLVWTRREEDMKVVAAFSRLWPGAKPLGEFLNTTLFAGRSIRDLRSYNGEYALFTYVKNCDISGSNLTIHEEYHGINKGDRAAGTLKRISLGGSKLAFSDLKKTIKITYVSSSAEEFTPNIEDTNIVSLYRQEERLLILDVNFQTYVSPEGHFRIYYEHTWPEAMWSGVDAVFYPEAIFYHRGIKELKSKLTFDSNLVRIAACWFDLDTKKCEFSANDLELRRREDNRLECNWAIEYPSNNRLYFVLFERSQYAKLTADG